MFRFALGLFGVIIAAAIGLAMVGGLYLLILLLAGLGKAILCFVALMAGVLFIPAAIVWAFHAYTGFLEI